MAFADYDALSQAIIRWADNEDVTERVGDFIALCHDRLNRHLRLEDMTVLAYIDTEVGNPWVPKPHRYLGMRRLKINDQRPPALTFKPLSRIDDDVGAAQQGRPRWYAVLGDRIRLAPVPEAAFQLETAYYQRVLTLDGTNVTNNVFLEQVSDLLLFGSLLEAESYLKDHEMWGTWVTKYAEIKQDVDVLAEAERFPEGDLAQTAV